MAKISCSRKRDSGVRAIDPLGGLADERKSTEGLCERNRLVEHKNLPFRQPTRHRERSGAADLKEARGRSLDLC